ncbi:MAG: hypothetical protein WCK67_13000 [bacterium]
MNRKLQLNGAIYQNVEGYQTGGIIKMKGNMNFLKSVLPFNAKILGIYDYVVGNVSKPIFIASGGKIYSFSVSSGL